MFFSIFAFVSAGYLKSLGFSPQQKKCFVPAKKT
jgi:hypothetical protein